MLHTRSDLQKQAILVCRQIVERYEAGETAKALAAEFGMHHDTVRALIKQSGVKVRARHKLTAEQREQVKAMYLANQTATEIGDHFGVYASTIQRQLKRMGVPLRPAHRRTQGSS